MRGMLDFILLNSNEIVAAAAFIIPAIILSLIVLRNDRRVRLAAAGVPIADTDWTRTLLRWLQVLAAFLAIVCSLGLVGFALWALSVGLSNWLSVYRMIW